MFLRETSNMYFKRENSTEKRALKRITLCLKLKNHFALAKPVCFFSFKTVADNASGNYIYLMQIQMSLKKAKELKEKQKKKRRKSMHSVTNKFNLFSVTSHQISLYFGYLFFFTRKYYILLGEH